MKITGLRIFARPDARPPWIFLKLYTNAGIEGLGEATSFPGGDVIIAALKEFEKLLVGRDPREIERNVYSMKRHISYLGADGACMAAISGLEIAMWDIVGQDFGAPIYRMLGGNCHDRFTLYANAWVKQAPFEPKAFAARALEEKKKGFGAIKFDPFSDPGCKSAAMDFPMSRTITPEQEEHGLEIVNAVREAVGPSVRIALDLHGRFNAATAIRVGRKFEDMDLLFLEEPTEPDNFAAMRKVSRALRLPICAGERYFGVKGFTRYFEEDILDVAMPDICRAGGILESRKIAAMAEAYGVLFAPHNPNGPVGTAASLHVQAVCPNALILEYFDDLTELRGMLGEGALKIANGEAQLPEGAGLGITIADEALENFATSNTLPGLNETVFGYLRDRV